MVIKSIWYTRLSNERHHNKMLRVNRTCQLTNSEMNSLLQTKTWKTFPQFFTQVSKTVRVYITTVQFFPALCVRRFRIALTASLAASELLFIMSHISILRAQFSDGREPSVACSAIEKKTIFMVQQDQALEYSHISNIIYQHKILHKTNGIYLQNQIFTLLLWLQVILYGIIYLETRYVINV